MAKSTHQSTLWKVLALYAAGSWLALQVVDILADNAGLPAWVFTLALILLIVGLPIVGATAYLHGIGGTAGSAASEGGSGGSRGIPTGTRRLFTWRKAIGGGVAAMALWGVLATGWMFLGPGANRGATTADAAGGSGATADAAPALRSVAVLPFATRSEERQDEYFSQGMLDDVLTQLAKIDSLTVISRTSVMQYAGTTKPIPEIARELGVATILEGGIQRAGDRVRVNVQLIEAATDRHLWAETYDEELTAANVFAIQSDLAKKIAAALRATLSPEETARIDAPPTESTEAFDLYSRARYMFLRPGSRVEALEQSRDLLLRAVALDSAYARAWALLGGVYFGLKDLGGLSAEEGRRLAEQAVDRALELDPELSEAHSARGLLLTDELRYDEAEKEILRALELNPGSAEEHRRYARLLLNVDRHEESVREARRAVELDPLSVTARATLGDALWWAGDWEGTVRESEKLIEMAPDIAYAYYNLGYGHAMLDENEKAIAAFRKAVELDPGDPNNVLGLAWGWARLGERDSAFAALEGVPREASMLKEIAIVHGTLGDFDEAFEILERLADENPGMIGQLVTDHSADPLRTDPRYRELLRRVGLE